MFFGYSVYFNCLHGELEKADDMLTYDSVADLFLDPWPFRHLLLLGGADEGQLFSTTVFLLDWTTIVLAELLLFNACSLTRQSPFTEAGVNPLVPLFIVLLL